MHRQPEVRGTAASFASILYIVLNINHKFVEIETENLLLLVKKTYFNDYPFENINYWNHNIVQNFSITNSYNIKR